jgi:acyl carrier protein
MTPDRIRQVIDDELTNIAPETTPADVPDDADLREALDIDSISFLNFVTALHQRLDIDIPEIDYAKLFTKRGAITYLAAKMKSP